MDKVKRGLSNQAIGFLPLLVFLLMDNSLNATLSFVISLFLSLICAFLYHNFSKGNIYQYSLIPTGIVLVIYAGTLALNLHPDIYTHSSAFIEAITVITLVFVFSSRPFILPRTGKKKKDSVALRTLKRNSLNEFYHISTLYLMCYVLHLSVTFCFLLLTSYEYNTFTMRLLLDYLPAGIGFMILFYEQIRVQMVKETLNKETWLPVINEKGAVIGNVAQSVSERCSKKYTHPVVRIAVLFNGMFYLIKRKKNEIVSPEQLDYPFSGYVLFQETIQEAITRITTTTIGKDFVITPRSLLSYPFENRRVKQLVYLFLIRLETEEQLDIFQGGKLWTPRQIDENLESHLFSDYFKQEYPYLQSTVLLVENLMNPKENKEESADS